MNRDGFASIIILTVIVAILIAGGVFYFETLKQSSTQPTGESYTALSSTGINSLGNIPATKPITVISSSQSGTIDQSSLISTNGEITISGTANVGSVSVEIQYIVAWNDNVPGGYVYEANIPVVNGRWSVSDPTKIDDGNYVVNIYSKQIHPLATGMLTVTGSVQPGLLIADPASSLAYLAVSFIASEPAGRYTIDFGDGSSTQIQTMPLQCPTGADNCGIPAGITSHIYQNDGSYTATLLNASGVILGAVTIPITGSACDTSADGGKTWQPVPCVPPSTHPEPN